MKKKMILAILAFYATVHLQAQNVMVPVGWYVRAKATDKCVLGLTERGAGRKAASAVAVYTSKGKQFTELLSIKSGDKRCSGVAMQETKYDTAQGCRAIQSSVVMLPESKSLLSVEGSDSADIQEMMLYKRRLSDLERQKAETYLAIKHDITISEYVSEAGDTLWNCEEAPDYSSRVFGIARDNVLGLDKVSCLSKRGDEEIRAMCVGIDAGDYLLFGEGDAHGYENSWRIVREGLAGRTVQISVGRNGRWHDSEPVAVLEKIIGATSIETHFESTSADDHYYTFAIRFENDIRGIYKLSLTTKETPQGTTAVSLGEGERNEKSASEAIYDDATAQVGIHPNPASDRIEIDGFAGKTKEVEIINPLGLSCKKVELGENEQFVDIHTLVSGNYMVVIRCGGDEYKVKLIKRGR